MNIQQTVWTRAGKLLKRLRAFERTRHGRIFVWILWASVIAYIVVREYYRLS